MNITAKAEWLDLVFYSKDLNREVTIKAYLKALLLTVWEKEEGFTGKRPFGNSGWTYSLYAVLISNQVIPGSFDEDGYIDKVDTGVAHDVVRQLIELAFEPVHAVSQLR